MRILEFIKNAAAQATQGRAQVNSASVARDRLQILISHEASKEAADPDFVSKLQGELLEVISKYVSIDREKIRVQLERLGDQSVLELNVTLSDAKQAALLAQEEAAATTESAKTEASITEDEATEAKAEEKTTA